MKHRNPKSNIHDIAVASSLPHSDTNSLSAKFLNDSHDSAKNDLSIQNESISQQIYKFADESTNI